MSFSIEGTNIPAKQGRIVKLVSGLRIKQGNQSRKWCSPSTRCANWVGCRPPGGNVWLAAPVPEYAYFAEHVCQSAIADAVDCLPFAETCRRTAAKGDKFPLRPLALLCVFAVKKKRI